ILPVTISMTKNNVGDVQIHNNSSYDIDVSGYQVVGEQTVTFPPRSIMVSRSTVTIPAASVSPVFTQAVVVYDQSGAEIAGYRPSQTLAQATPIVTANLEDDFLTIEASKSLPAGFTFAEPDTDRDESREESKAASNLIESTTSF